MLSNKLTFSLASLVVLIAVGILFVPMSVMAHPEPTTGDDASHGGNAAPADNHKHPTLEIIIEDDDTSTSGIQVIDEEEATANAATLAFTVYAKMDENFTNLTDTLNNADFTFSSPYLDNYGAVADLASNDLRVGTFALVPETSTTDTHKSDPDNDVYVVKAVVTATFENASSVTDFNVDMSVRVGAILSIRVGPYQTGTDGHGSLAISPISIKVLQTGASIKKEGYVTIPNNTPPTTAFDATVTFTEAYADFAADDLTISYGQITSVTAPTENPSTPTDGDNANKVWTVNITPLVDATEVTVSLNADKFVAPTGKSLSAKTGQVPAGSMDDIEIAAGGYLVLIHEGAGASDTGITGGTNGATTASGYFTRDLYEFFRDGGTINLKGPADSKLRISEIMWGRDASLSTPKHSQWIELENYGTDTDGAITFGSGWSLEFVQDVSTATAVDRVGNLGNPGYWQVPGNSGRTVATNTLSITALVSMNRKFDKDAQRSEGWVASARPQPQPVR